MEFDEFARAQLPGLVRFAAALTGDPQLAQDLAQDTMVRAYLKWSRVSAADRPDLYLRRMLVNGHLSWRRRWYQRAVRATAELPESPHAVLADPAHRSTDRAELATLLAGLGRAQRTAIVLRFYEDLDDTEIGAVLGCAPATVRGYISRGLAALRIQARAADAPHPTTPEVSTS